VLTTISLHSAPNSTPAASNGDCQRVRSHYTENINRFLADQHQRPPIGLGPVRTEEEAVAAGEARASDSVTAFKIQFDSGNTSPGARFTPK
jgi:hypothetical protein